MEQNFFLFAQDVPDGGGIGGVIILLIQLAIIVLVIAGFWKTFTKAGKPGWGAIIPIWWIILFLIPFVNLVVAIIVSIDVAKNFGKGAGFGLGLAFLGFIFYPILGFGDARYQPAA